VIEAAKNAARAADRSTDGVVLLDSIDVMEAGMRYFFGRFQAERAEKKPDWGKADAALLQAVAIAKDITPYRHPRLPDLLRTPIVQVAKPRKEQRRRISCHRRLVARDKQTKTSLLFGRVRPSGQHISVFVGDGKCLGASRFRPA
jgi:hypothetical protein